MNEKRVARMLREVSTYPMPALVGTVATALADHRFHRALMGLGAAFVIFSALVPFAEIG